MQPTNPQGAPPQQQPPVAPVQHVPVQPVYIQPPSQPQQPLPPIDDDQVAPPDREVVIYSHSRFMYWWPVWVVGYIMTAISWFGGTGHTIGDRTIYFHENGSLGVVFLMILFLVIAITNVSVRGIASAMVVLSLVLVTVLLAFFNVWDNILGWLGNLRIYLNVGAYFWFSTLILVLWIFTVFVYDRMNYWRFKPGQVTHEFVLGAGTRTYDTENLVLEKFRDDLFRHWILGLGSGDLHLIPFGARTEELTIPNVAFVGWKIDRIMRLINLDGARIVAR